MAPDDADAGIRGWLDFSVGLIVQGWLCDICSPGRRMAVEILVDGDIALRLTADRYRADVAAAGLGDGHSGFLAFLPESLCDGSTHSVMARVADGGMALPGGPITVGLDPDLLRATRALLEERKQLQHRLALNESRLISAFRASAASGLDALDPALVEACRRMPSEWVPGRDDEP